MKKTEIKAKWLHELRNGGHEQVPGTLKGIKEDGTVGYCCLGVLEEKVLGHYLMAVGLVDPEYDNDKPYYSDEGAQKSYDYIKDVIIGDSRSTDDYAQKNDNGWTFAELADYIERDWNPDVNETVE